MTDRTGQLDCYQLIRRLGSGTFGQVYLAKDRHRNKDVAIKILPSLTNEDLPRFLTEARIMMRLKHFQIVQILDFGIDVEKQAPFLVMEYATNGTLRQRHPKGSCVPLPTILSYIGQLAAALQVAHDDQVIHRDIKPENMLLNQQDQLLLSDFGIATMVPSSALHSAQTFGGTIPYMAPEQTEGRPCPASDQYSLAVVAYEWICGQRPFHGSIFEIAIQHRLNPPPSLREQDPMVAPEVEQVVFKALAKDPMERFANVETFAQALESAYSEHTLQISVSSEVLLSESAFENSKKSIPNKKADYPPSISGDNAAALEAGAITGVADPVKQGTQQPAVLITPFPQINSKVSTETSDMTLSPVPDTLGLATGIEIGVIELLLSSQLTDSRPTAKLSDVSSASINDDWGALSPDPVGGTGSGMIEVPSSLGAIPSQSMAKPFVASEATDSVQSSLTPLSHAFSQQGNTGKTAIITGASATASPSQGVGVSRSPVRDSKATQGAKRERGLIVAILIIVLLSGVASSGVGLQLFQFSQPPVSKAAWATTTITPDSKLEQDSYVIQAVTSNADPTQRQIASRQLTFSPQSQSKSVTATGVGHVSSQAATGQLTFYNGSDQTFVVDSRIPIPGPNGVFVETDGPATIPTVHLPTVGSITVNAHVTTAGANGNMATGAINETCCASGGFITVVSSAFTGGQDEKDYTFLQQSDVDGYASQLKSMLSQQALNGLKGQLKPNEQLAGDPQCPIQSSEDQPVGDQGHNVPSANITVDATCTGLAYDASAARTLAQDLLIRKAISNLGQGYALAGTILTKQTVTDVKDGVVTLQVAVAGTWYYQFNDKLKQALTNQLANKTHAASHTKSRSERQISNEVQQGETAQMEFVPRNANRYQGLLNAYKGVANARIDIANGGDSLPSDPNQISIVVVAVSGVSPTNLPALEPASPLSVSKGRG